MKIGRNDPCPCGSGKKFKKCCAGKIPQGLSLSRGEIDVSGVFPRLIGFDDSPDLKKYILKGIFDNMLEKDLDIEKIMEQSQLEYNKKIIEVNSALERPYGTMLGEGENLLEVGEYEKAIALAEHMLSVYPESIESRNILESAFFSLNKHPLQECFTRIRSDLGKEEKRKELENFAKHFNKAAPKAKQRSVDMIKKYFYECPQTEKYLAMRILNSTLMSYCFEFAETGVKNIESLILEAIQSDSGAMRALAIHCVAATKMDAPCELLFNLYEVAKKEQFPEKKRSQCKAMLQLNSFSLSLAMERLSRTSDYKNAIRFAVESTESNYDSDYDFVSHNKK